MALPYSLSFSRPPEDNTTKGSGGPPRPRPPTNAYATRGPFVCFFLFPQKTRASQPSSCRSQTRVLQRRCNSLWLLQCYQPIRCSIEGAKSNQSVFVRTVRIFVSGRDRHLGDLGVGARSRFGRLRGRTQSSPWPKPSGSNQHLLCRARTTPPSERQA